MRLASQPPRRFTDLRSPGYPALVTACALAATTACQTQTHATAPTTPAAAAPTQVASAPTSPLWVLPRASRFPVDDKPVDLSAGYGCGGDCPSPFEMAAEEKDRAQVQARVDFCVDRAERKAPVAPVDFVVRGKIDRNGESSNVETTSEEAPLDSDLRACVLDLVRTARFTPPEKARKERSLWTSVHTHKKATP
jgi:hypothetical protein